MFSPDAGNGSRQLDRAAALRGDSINSSNPRRRQRTSSADSLNVRRTNPKRRKRSALAEDTFVEPNNDDDTQHTLTRRSNRLGAERATSRNQPSGNANGYTDVDGHRRHRPSNGIPKSPTTSINVKDPSPPAAVLTDASLDPGSLAVRSRGSRKEKRGRNGVEDGVELTRTDNYVLTRDRGIPAQLQDILGSEPWHATFCPDLGFAVALTHAKAIVWRYGHTRIHGHDLGVNVIKLPSHSGSGYENLPLGTLTHDAGAGDLALLVLMPGGKAAYYESVRAAAGVEGVRAQAFEILHGSISGTFSSEHAVQVEEAESDGFILSTNHGRLFHLSVRDSQGRPHISSQQLRMPSHDKVGIFGSIRNAITGGGSQDVASIITLPGRSRSLKHVLVSTKRGAVQLWSIARHGAKAIEREWDLKEALEVAFKSAVASTVAPPSTTLLDVALIRAGRDITRDEHQIMCLVSFPESSAEKYLLVGLNLRDGAADVEHIHAVHSYTGTEHTADLSGKSMAPRLLTPEAHHTAFIVFDTKIVIVSLSRPEDTPDSQLHAEAQDLADSYEECLFFERKLPYHSAGCASQIDDDRTDRAERAVCDIMIHGFGHVKLAAVAAPPGEAKAERRANIIRSRLEQVVFFGALNDNFINFRDAELWSKVTLEDISQATIKIISSILDSTSAHVPPLMPSMEQQLKLRSQAILDLNRFVQQWTLSATECWRLLWAAEKLASARAVYSLYNQVLAVRTGSEQKVLLEELIDMIAAQDRYENEPERGEHDHVRHFLIWDIARFGNLVGWAQQSIDLLVQEGLTSVEEMAPLVVQATDILTTSLKTAWAFREDHAEAFGLGRDVIENGIYLRSYADMPEEPWTGTQLICDRTRLLVNISKDMALQLDTIDFSSMPFDDDLVDKLASQAGEVTDCTFRSWEEQCRWVEASSDQRVHAQAQKKRSSYKTIRQDLLSALVELSAHEMAANLAEKYTDMDALALVTSKIRQQGSDWIMATDPQDQQAGQVTLDEIDGRTNQYFDKYGKGWAHAFYSREVENDEGAVMLSAFPDRAEFLTEFLRSEKTKDKRYYKLSWMNEISREHDFAEAAKDLWMAERAESRLWAKQVGLALSKLARYAAIEQRQMDTDEALRDIKGCTQRIKFTEIQQRLYDYICPLLHRAIDEEAELELVMNSFGSYVNGHAGLTENLRNIMHQIVCRRVIGIEELIEVLTLMSPSDQLADTDNFADERFYFALYLLHGSRLEVNHSDRAVLHQRIIWRRVILQDDWIALNRTEGKSDEAVMEELRRTALYKTLRAGYEDGLFDKHPPYEPNDLHPAGETTLQLREAGMYPKRDDSYLAKVAKDLTAEDTALDEAYVKGRLQLWWKGVVACVRADLRGERDAYARLREATEQEYEREMAAAERETVLKAEAVADAEAASEAAAVQAMSLDGTAEDVEVSAEEPAAVPAQAAVPEEGEQPISDNVQVIIPNGKSVSNGHGESATNGHHHNNSNSHGHSRSHSRNHSRDKQHKAAAEEENGSAVEQQLMQETKKAASKSSGTKKGTSKKGSASGTGGAGGKKKASKKGKEKDGEGDVVMAS